MNSNFLIVAHKDTDAVQGKPFFNSRAQKPIFEVFGPDVHKVRYQRCHLKYVQCECVATSSTREKLDRKLS